MVKIMFKETEEIIDEFRERSANALIQRMMDSGLPRSEIANKLQIRREAIYGYINDNHHSVKLNRTMKMFMRYGYCVELIVSRQESLTPHSVEGIDAQLIRSEHCFRITKEKDFDLIQVRKNLLVLTSKFMDKDYAGKTLTETQKLTGVDGTRLLFLRNVDFDATKMTIDYYLRLLLTLGFDVVINYCSMNSNDVFNVNLKDIRKSLKKVDKICTPNSEIYSLRKAIADKILKTVFSRHSTTIDAVEEFCLLLRIPLQQINKLIKGELEKFTIEDLIQYAKNLNVPLNITIG